MNQQQPVEKGALWPFIVFLVIAFMGGSLAFLVSFIASAGGMQEVARSFQEGGIFMYLLLLAQGFTVLILCAVSFFYVVKKQIPSSLFVVPAFGLWFVGLFGTYIGLTQALGAIDQAAPEQRLNYAFVGSAMAANTDIMGSLAASSIVGLVALLAAMRAFAFKTGPIAKSGLIIVAVGVVASLVATGLTSFGFDDQMLALLIGFSALFAVSMIGTGSLVPLSDWKDGANRLLLNISAILTVTFTWLGTRGVIYKYLGVFDLMAPEQRASMLFRGFESKAHVDVAGWTCVAIVVITAVASLVLGGRFTLAGLFKARISTAFAVLTFVGCVAMAFVSSSREETLINTSDRGDVSYYARYNKNFQPTYSKTAERPRRTGVSVIINPDKILIDGREIVPTQGFQAQSPRGTSLKTGLKQGIADWEARQKAIRDNNPILPEVEDWVNQQADDINNAKRNDNRFGIKGPADGPDPHMAHREEERWPMRTSFAVAIHKDVPFSTVKQVFAVFRQSKIPNVDLLVTVQDRDLPADFLETVPPRYQKSSSDYGLIPVTIGPSVCGWPTNTAQFEANPSLGLSLKLSENSYTVEAQSGDFPSRCGSKGVLNADLELLKQCLAEIKEEYPRDHKITISASDTMSFQAVVKAMDVARYEPGEGRRSRSALIRSLTDDGLFENVHLFVGNDLSQTCKVNLSEESSMRVSMGLGNSPFRSSGSDPTNQPGGTPRIRTGSPMVRGSLSKEVVRRSIRRHINQIRYCYEQQVARQPDLAGRISIRFVIAPSGAVSTASVADSTLNNPPAEQCIARAIQRIAFPQPEGGGVVIVTQPFMLALRN